jgi:tight adherence protein B
MDLEGRKDARARQAGARFARRFVLIVPAGMAMAGMGIGDGRAAYATPLGQGAVLVAAVMVAACWWWAGRVMAMPRAARVFTT